MHFYTFQAEQVYIFIDTKDFSGPASRLSHRQQNIWTYCFILTVSWQQTLKVHRRLSHSDWNKADYRTHHFSNKPFPFEGLKQKNVTGSGVKLKEQAGVFTLSAAIRPNIWKTEQKLWKVFQTSPRYYSSVQEELITIILIFMFLTITFLRGKINLIKK